jgi:hypothetical protein
MLRLSAINLRTNKGAISRFVVKTSRNPGLARQLACDAGCIENSRSRGPPCSEFLSKDKVMPNPIGKIGAVLPEEWQGGGDSLNAPENAHSRIGQRCAGRHAAEETHSLRMVVCADESDLRHAQETEPMSSVPSRFCGSGQIKNSFAASCWLLRRFCIATFFATCAKNRSSSFHAPSLSMSSECAHK